MENSDFINGWEPGVLQLNAVNNCHCNLYGDRDISSFFLSFPIKNLILNFNRPHAVSIKVFSTWTKVSNVTSWMPSMNRVSCLFKHVSQLLTLPGNNPVQNGKHFPSHQYSTTYLTSVWWSLVIMDKNNNLLVTVYIWCIKHI